MQHDDYQDAQALIMCLEILPKLFKKINPDMELTDQPYIDKFIIQLKESMPPKRIAKIMLQSTIALAQSELDLMKAILQKTFSEK